MRSGIKQSLVIAGTVLLTAALYLAPQKVKKENVIPEKTDVLSFEALKSEAKGQLKRQEVEKINEVEAAFSKDSSSKSLADSLGVMWDRLNMPQVAAHYYELIALSEPSETNWINTAYRYYDAFRIAGDSTLRKAFVDRAISSYQKVLQINPDNLDAKTDLGICYTEGTSSPMQGIMMLREVVAKNPEHEMAQFNLGILSVKSGQYDKAVERFEKVLSIDPENNEARFLLARTFVMTGNKEQALKNLKMIKESNDPQLNEQVNTLINQINNN